MSLRVYITGILCLCPQSSDTNLLLFRTLHHSVKCAVFSVHCEVFSAHCAVFKVYHAFSSVHCSVCTVQSSFIGPPFLFSLPNNNCSQDNTDFILQSTISNAYSCSLFTLQCKAFSVYLAALTLQCSLHCALVTVQWSLWSCSQSRCCTRFRAGAFPVTPVSASNQPRGHGLRQLSLCS